MSGQITSLTILSVAIPAFIILKNLKRGDFMIKKTNANKYGVVEYAVSTEDEIAQLPYLVGQGSVAIVIETGNVFMFNEGTSSWHSLVDSSQVVTPNGLKSITKEIEAHEITTLSMGATVEEVVKDTTEEAKASKTKPLKNPKKNSKKVK